MRPVHVAQLVLLSLLWGGAYLFMRASAPAFGAMPMVFLRMALASLLVLLPLTLWRSGFGPIRRHGREIAVFGLAFTALPFAGLGFAALSISAGCSRCCSRRRRCSRRSSRTCGSASGSAACARSASRSASRESRC